MSTIGSLGAFAGNRYSANKGAVGVQKTSFLQRDIASIRGAETEGIVYNFTVVNDGADTIQWLFDHYAKGSAALPPELSEEQLDTLAKQIDPNNITQRSYDQLVDTLVGMGLFSREELGAIEVHAVPTSDHEPDPAFDAYMPYWKVTSHWPSPTDSALQDWAQENELLLCAYDSVYEGERVFSLRQANTLRKLMPILENIAQRRA